MNGSEDAGFSFPAFFIYHTTTNSLALAEA
jgi:hypothetical protein